jgi:hypothetical protein
VAVFDFHRDDCPALSAAGPKSRVFFQPIRYKLLKIVIFEQLGDCSTRLASHTPLTEFKGSSRRLAQRAVCMELSHYKDASTPYMDLAIYYFGFLPSRHQSNRSPNRPAREQNWSSLPQSEQAGSSRPALTGYDSPVRPISFMIKLSGRLGCIVWLHLMLVVATLGLGCGRQSPAPHGSSAGSSAQASALKTTAQPSEDDGSSSASPAVSRYDLDGDEALGGHTLARHVGKSDQELADRLRRERQISAASTYTDAETAARVVGAAVSASSAKLRAWADQEGSHPNLVLTYRDPGPDPIGRSLSRRARKTQPCFRVRLVVRWIDRSSRWFVLTSYPEAG